MKKRINLFLVVLLSLLLPAISHARYLNPSTGRFQTMDSYEGKTQEPQSLHKYVYVHQNSVIGKDAGHVFNAVIEGGTLKVIDVSQAATGFQGLTSLKFMRIK